MGKDLGGPWLMFLFLISSCPYSFPLHMLPDNHVTVGWLSNNMSADHEEVHIPVKKAKPKQPKVVKF